MGTDTKTLSGPDLEAGVKWEGLADGQPLLGHAGGEAVMLVRRGDEVFATASSCTHYGGPLAEGLVVGDTVHCPWHHACFDLRTGRAIGAPALNDIACFEVQRSAGLVRVGKKREAAAQKPAAGAAIASVVDSVVIVGAGPAGAVCAETLRKLGYRGSVTLLGDEAPVDRPNLSKDYLAGSAPEEWMPLRPPEFHGEQNIDFVLGDTAAAIDTAARRVTLASGKTLSYGALVLATGAEPRRLSIPGADLPHVRLLRTLADSRSIISRAGEAKRAVVIGASFIGLEAAASLRARGLEVDVVGHEAVPLARVLGDEVGAVVRQAHEAKGVRFHLGQQPQAIDAREVKLSGGALLPADLVVVGVGVVPRTSLAQAAGLRVDNGIVVDQHLRTSVPDVYAVGDVARVPDARSGGLVRIEHFVVAERQGQAAARIILGDQQPYRDVPFFWSMHPDLGLAYVGSAAGWDQVRIRGDLPGRDFAAFYLKQGRVLAVLTAGRDQVSLRAEQALQAGDDGALDELMAQ
jgi:NADPH-dependent 2,4-dienoyl-CoA reductase/sulfur reductase-like enzyme/nitrite reductase/ring-hydroxylating ferredoxin subunit